jgi:hypothetical protein
LSTPRASAGNRGKWGTQPSLMVKQVGHPSPNLPQASWFLGMTILLVQ